MTKFEDQLFADLMDEYRPVLRRLEQPVAAAKPRRAPARRVAWLTGVATAGAVATGVALLGGGTPAYAVTQHPNGTVTVSLTSAAGVKPANIKLRVLGDRVVVVPVGSGCPSMSSLPRPKFRGPVKVTTSGNESNGTLTVDAHGIPAGETMIIAASTRPGGGMELAGSVISGAAPSCVSLPAPPPGGPSGSGSSGGSSNG
jgi:hypothetical protein